MIFAIPVVVLLVVVVGIILAKRSTSGQDEIMVSSADRLGERSAESSEALQAAATERRAPREEATDPSAAFERLVEPEPVAKAEPASPAATPEPPPVVASDPADPTTDEPSTLEPLASFAVNEPAEVEAPAEPQPDLTPEPLVKARVMPAPEPPEPLVKARVTPVDTTALPATGRVDATRDEFDEDSSALSRFMTPGARNAVAPVAATPAPEPAPIVAETEAEVEPDAEPIVAEAPAPEPVVAEVEPIAAEPEPVAAASEPTVEVEPAAVEPVVVDEPVADAAPDEIVAEIAEAEPAIVAEAEVPDAVEPEPAAEADVEIEAEAEAVVPAPVQLQPEPELDPVDHVLKALIHRAKVKQVGIAEVAAELVEQANLEERDIDEVLAELVDRVDDDDENIDPSERLEELTLFNNSVPRRPGQLTDFERLDKAHKKRVIIRVLCLLVAMQEDNRLTPSEPRSEAETRHWPLARAVWPVAALEKAEQEREAKGEGDPLDPSLPDRRLITKR